jgi:sugar lactone lactonase YvrE
VHKFSPDGKLLKTWGGFGNGSGQFALPHKLDIDRHGTVYVCDRNNDRIQMFNSDGEFISMWTDFHFPHDIYIDRKNDIAYVVEAMVNPPHQPKISIRDLKGKVLSEWGGRESEKKGALEIPHGICVDSYGDIYVGEIVRTRRIQKFIKVS